MNLLALDTSTDVGSVALLQEGRLIAQHMLRAPMSLLSWLVPAIQKTITETHLSLEKIDAIAVSNGPGSFTGVRLQIATARSLAQVRGIPLYGISSLEALAFQALPCQGMILSCIDARRGELFTGIFENDGQTLIQKEDYACLTPDAVVARTILYKKPWILIGETNPYLDFLVKHIPDAREAPGVTGVIQASSIGILALRKRHEQSGDIHAVEPIYLRASNAEIERKQEPK